MFASATQRIPLSLVGILQYVSPTLQFLLGVLIYKEPFEPDQLVGYGIVWAALILLAVEGIVARRAAPVAVVAE
jgi:chloramphenicol-sensitive protein RarD